MFPAHLADAGNVSNFALRAFGGAEAGDGAGLAPSGPGQDSAAHRAAEFADELVARDPSLRLGLVPARSGPDALRACGWQGPLNYTNDTGEIAAEHFAFCPDNVWQGSGSLARYADRLVGATAWAFWWD